MAEHIEREKLMADFELCNKQNPRWTPQRVASLIARATVADVVEVPCHCKDCKHWMDFPNCGCTEFVKVCALAEYMIGQNGYCLYGERKDGE